MEKTLKEQQDLCIIHCLKLTLEILKSRNLRKVDNSDVLTSLRNDIDTLERYFKVYSDKAIK